MDPRALIGAPAALHSLPLWQAAEERDALVRSLKFADFPTAIAFMQAVAKSAERLDHHPEWRNVYDRVEVLLSTHSAGGVTGMDVALAQAIDQAAAQFGAGVAI